MKKIIFSSILMFITLFFLIVKLNSQGTQATQISATSTSSLSATQNMGQKQTTSGYTTARPKAGRMTKTS